MTYNILILALELKTTQRAHDQLRAQEEEITRKWNKASMLSEFQQIKLSCLKVMTVKIIRVSNDLYLWSSLSHSFMSQQ